MRTVIQRVKYAKVNVDGKTIGEIGKGLLVLLGITHEDTIKEVKWLANKTKNLRIFEDEEERQMFIEELGITEPSLNRLIRGGFKLLGLITYFTAGEKEVIEKNLDLFKEKGARRALPLAVSGPFHSSLMKPVAEILKKEFENYIWNDPATPIIANTTANILTSAEDIKNELYNQTFGPVKWVDTINKLAENGVTKIYEIGPGKVLSGLIKKIDKEIEVENIELI